MPEKTPPAPAVKLLDALEATDILDELLAEHADAIAAADGDIEAVPAIAELLAFAEDQLTSAVERWAFKVKRLEADAEANKYLARHYGERAAARANAAERLKAYLVRVLQTRGLARLQGATATIALQNNSRPSFRAVTAEAMEELYASGSPFVREKRELLLDDGACMDTYKTDPNLLPLDITATVGQHLRIR
jgi:hypothetical protein